MSDDNNALAGELAQLFQADQKIIAEFDAAKRSDPKLKEEYETYRQRVITEQHRNNFYDAFVLDLWVESGSAPDEIKRFQQFRLDTNARVRSIIEERGWPQRKDVGDTAAIMMFFLFGHGDNDNDWRQTQASTIERVNAEDKLNPRLFAHMIDRLRDVGGDRQLYGSIMGPGKDKGTARLYTELEFDQAKTNEKRKAIGLPTLDEDLDRFRNGAQIGPYMTPLVEGQHWDLSDAYNTKL